MTQARSYLFPCSPHAMLRTAAIRKNLALRKRILSRSEMDEIRVFIVANSSRRPWAILLQGPVLRSVRLQRQRDRGMEVYWQHDFIRLVLVVLTALMVA